MITVLEPGRLTSFQDLGREGFAHLGVPRAGAADSLSLRHANLLVGNPEGNAALEMTLTGPSLRFDTDAVIALTGGRLEACLDDVPVPMYQSVTVHPGQTLVCGPLFTGMRAYLAVAGGFSTSPVLDSASRDTLAGLGPSVLQGGETLDIEPRHLGQGWYLRTEPEFDDSVSLRVIAGPHPAWFAEGTFSEFLQSSFEIRNDSDRSGLRLAGSHLIRSMQGELHSQGMVCGAVQVPSDGHPIILLCNHGTTGGYPVIAVVIAADLPRLGQMRSGSSLRFEEVNRQQAVTALRASETALRHAIMPADSGLLAARSLLMLAKSHPTLREANLQLRDGRVRLRR